MARWIFQDIEDIRNRTLYKDTTRSLKERNEEHIKELREKVDPKVFTKYCIWLCDVYVDAYSIGIAVNNVYPKIAIEQAVEWVLQFKEPHQVII